jgi:ubiquinone/menaquinone biosynthesis C-methylase UbiE
MTADPTPTPTSQNPVVDAYSRLATAYDDPRNIESCWGRVTAHAATFVELQSRHRVVVDVGCGTGRTLERLASGNAAVRFLGVEPAATMRAIAESRTSPYSNVQILDGTFEALPLETSSVDYLFSNLAFHWTTDLHKSVAELARVLKPSGDMDLAFIGRENGREFIRQTSPIFFRYLTPKQMMAAVSRRKQLTLDQALGLFAEAFDRARLTVTESYHTYYDTLDGHFGWWVRIEGQLVDMPPAVRQECDASVKAALKQLETPDGIPYTVHLLHVALRNP